MALKLRRGTDAERLTITPQEGELIYVTDSKKLYVGDGTTQGGNLVTPAFNDDTSPALGGDLNLGGNNIVGTGNININGTITASGNINLGDGSEDNVIVGGQIGSSLIPKVNDSYDLGAPAGRWGAVHAFNGHFGGAVTVNDLITNGNIVKDDSTVIYNGATDTLNVTVLNAKSIVGDFKGSIVGDDSTVLVDAVNNILTGDVVTNSVSLGAPGDPDLVIDTYAAGVAQLTAYGTSWIQNLADRVYVGTTERSSQLRTYSNAVANQDSVFIQTYANAIGSNNLNLHKARGTGTAPLTIEDGDEIYTVKFSGYEGTNFNVASAQIVGEVSGTVGTNKIPGKLRFQTANTSGTLGTAFYIENDQTTQFVGTPEIRNVPMTHYSAGNTATASETNFKKNRGAITTPTIVQNTDEIHNLRFMGYDGSAYRLSARIQSSVDGTPGAGQVPGRLTLSTADSAGTLKPAFYIDSDQVTQYVGSINVRNINTSYQTAGPDATARSIDFQRSRGDLNIPDIVEEGDQIYNLRFSGHNGNDYQVSAQIAAIVDADPADSTSAVPGGLRFFTADSAGDLQNALYIDSNQQVNVYTGLSRTNAPETSERASNDTAGVIDVYKKARGTLAAPATVNSGDYIHTFRFQAHDGSAYNTVAQIRAEASTTVGPGAIGGQLRLLVSDDTGTIGTGLFINEAKTVSVFGAFRMNPRSSAPSSPVTGGMYTADGTTWDPASKGGAVPYPVFYDGVSYNALY